MTSTPRRSQASSMGLLKGIVGAPDGVEAGLLEQLDPAFLGAVDGGRPERAVVVVHTGTAEEDRLAVDAQSPRRVDGQGPDPERRRLLVEDLVAVHQGRPAGVEVRIVGTPSVRRRHAEPLPGREDVARHRRDRRLGPGDDVPLCVERPPVAARRSTPRSDWFRTSALTATTATSSSISGVSHLQAARHQVDPSSLEQPDAAVDAAARVPPAVVVGARLDLDLVGLAEAQQVVDLDGEVRVAARPVGHQRVVHPHLGVAVDAVEFQEDGAPRVVGRRARTTSCTPRSRSGSTPSPRARPATAPCRSWRRGAGSPAPAPSPFRRSSRRRSSPWLRPSSRR